VVIFIVLNLVPKETDKNKEVNESLPTVTIKTESEPNNEEAATSQDDTSQLEEQSNFPEFKCSKDWSADDSYLLAKIAMAEAEDCSIKCKQYIILAVLNRVWSDDFPDTIEEVIKEEHNGVYQYSPLMKGGRWYTTEPNDECYKAARLVMEAKYDISEGALFFEDCEDEDNWHSRNLEFLYEIDGMRFYR